MISLKPVFLIAIVVIAMIGIMVKEDLIDELK
jgi:hypothetical protein